METLQNESAYLGAFALAAITVLVLLTVILLQNKKIRELKQPKFGFLGKPLSVLLLALVLGGGYGMFYYSSQKENDEVIVSADQEVSIDVIVTELNAVTNLYKLNAIPSIDNLTWGEGNKVFDIYWTLDTPEGRETEVETGLSRNNPGGLDVILPVGNNVIKATIFLEDKVIEKEIRIVVN